MAIVSRSNRSGGFYDRRKHYKRAADGPTLEEILTVTTPETLSKISAWKQQRSQKPVEEANPVIETLIQLVGTGVQTSNADAQLNRRLAEGWQVIHIAYTGNDTRHVVMMLTAQERVVELEPEPRERTRKPAPRPQAAKQSEPYAAGSIVLVGGEEAKILRYAHGRARVCFVATGRVAWVDIHNIEPLTGMVLHFATEPAPMPTIGQVLNGDMTSTEKIELLNMMAATQALTKQEERRRAEAATPAPVYDGRNWRERFGGQRDN